MKFFFFSPSTLLFSFFRRAHTLIFRGEKIKFFNNDKKKLLLKKKTYTIYSILAIVFVILLLVTAFVTVALTYCEWSGS